MHYNLITNYYIDKNKSRKDELNFCMLENINNSTFHNIIIIGSETDINSLMAICPEQHKSKILPVVFDKKPSYNDYFSFITKLFGEQDNITVISNLDVIVPTETLVYSSWYLLGKSCLALTRWDINSPVGYKENSSFLNRPDSQDTWIFKGAVPQIAGATFTLGMAGCDNSLAHLLEKAGYDVKNPSKTLKTFHYHITNVRNYLDIVGFPIERIPPPYKLLQPTE